MNFWRKMVSNPLTGRLKMYDDKEILIKLTKVFRKNYDIMNADTAVWSAAGIRGLCEKEQRRLPRTA